MARKRGCIRGIGCRVPFRAIDIGLFGGLRFIGQRRSGLGGQIDGGEGA